MKFTARDETRLVGLHPDLVRVMRRAAADTPLQFAVIEGMRTLATQRAYVAKGASKTMKSTWRSSAKKLNGAVRRR